MTTVAPISFLGMEQTEEGEGIVPVMPTPKVVATGKKRKVLPEQPEAEGGM